MHEEIIKAQEDNSLTINYNKRIFDMINLYLCNCLVDIGVRSSIISLMKKQFFFDRHILKSLRVYRASASSFIRAVINYRSDPK